MIKTKLFSAAVMGALAANMALATTELVTNGGFEDGFTGWTVNNPGDPSFFGAGSGFPHTGFSAVNYGATDGQG